MGEESEISEGCGGKGMGGERRGRRCTVRAINTEHCVKSLSSHLSWGPAPAPAPPPHRPHPAAARGTVSRAANSGTRTIANFPPHSTACPCPLGTGYWVLGTGYWVLGTGYWVLCSYCVPGGPRAARTHLEHKEGAWLGRPSRHYNYRHCG